MNRWLTEQFEQNPGGLVYIDGRGGSRSYEAERQRQELLDQINGCGVWDAPATRMRESAGPDRYAVVDEIDFDGGTYYEVTYQGWYGQHGALFDDLTLALQDYQARIWDDAHVHSKAWWTYDPDAFDAQPGNPWTSTDVDLKTLLGPDDYPEEWDA